MWVEQTLSCLPGRHLGSGPRHTGSMGKQSSTAAPGTGPLSDRSRHPCMEGGWQRDSVNRQHELAQLQCRAGRRLRRSPSKWGSTIKGNQRAK